MPPKDDFLNKKLGIGPMEEPNPAPLFKKSISSIVTDVQSKEEADFDLARNKITEVLESGTTAIEEMLEIAKETQHPRSYEVLANLLKTQAEVSLDLLRLQQAKLNIDNLKGNSGSPQTINNNLVIGSADTLLKMIKKAKEEKVKFIDVDDED